MVVFQSALWIFAAATLLSVAVWGSQAGRLAAAIVFVDFAGSVLVQSVFLFGIQAGVLALDLAMFASLVVLAHRVRLWWTRAIAGFAAVSVLIHVSAASAAGIWLLEYVGVGWVASTLIVFALLISLPECRTARRLDRWAAGAG